MEVKENLAGYGVIGTLRGKYDGPIIGFRADMDALPIQEENDFPFRSQIDGVMHACGHDAHTAMLMGTAEILSELRDRIHGTIKFIFQPQEEVGCGAKKMLEAGALDDPKVEVLLGMHLLFNESGTIAFKKGYALSASDTFSIVVRGKGGHGAKPHETNDPLLTACTLVSELQYIVSRKINPQQMGILTVGSICSGKAPNVIPDSATMTGTVRTLKSETQDIIEQEITRITKGICDTMGCSYEVSYDKGCAAVYNDPDEMNTITEGLEKVLPKEKIIELFDARCGSEDFSGFYREGLKTGYIWLGGAYPGEECPSTNHQPKYNWDERTMETGLLAASAVILHLTNDL